MRLDLFNGEVRGTVAPSGGGACDLALWSNAVYATADVSAIKVNCSEGVNVTFTWVPHWAPEFGGRVVSRPRKRISSYFLFGMGCADTVPSVREPNTPL